MLSWQACQIGCFQRLDGVPAVLRIDNGKTRSRTAGGLRSTACELLCLLQEFFIVGVQNPPRFHRLHALQDLQPDDHAFLYLCKAPHADPEVPLRLGVVRVLLRQAFVRDWGFFTVAMPNFWERPEMSGMLRDVRLKPDKYDWLKNEPFVLPAPPPPSSSAAVVTDPDAAILQILASLSAGDPL
jgi:hypothetical protein